MEKLCMSYLNKKNKNVRCTRKKILGTDFCGYHGKSRKYMKSLTIEKNFIDSIDLKKMIITYIIDQANKKIIDSREILNRDYNHCLLGLYDDWNDISFIYWFFMDGEWWDIRMLINIISEQLNQSNMENPSPMYPSNPFNRNLIEPTTLINIREKIKNGNIKVNVALKKFLCCDIILLNLCYEEAKEKKSSNEIRKILKEELRYMLVNSKNSQDCYVGHWVKKTEPLTNFEQLYNELDKISFQIIHIDNFGNIQIIDNPFRNYLLLIIEEIPRENNEIVYDEYIDNI